MSKSTKSYGDPVALVYTRPRKCADKADGSNCGNKTRMAMVVPTRDPGEEPQLSCVSLCGGCLPAAFEALVRGNMKNGSEIFPFVASNNPVILEALAQLVANGNAVLDPKTRTVSLIGKSKERWDAIQA